MYNYKRGRCAMAIRSNDPVRKLECKVTGPRPSHVRRHWAFLKGWQWAFLADTDTDTDTDTLILILILNTDSSFLHCLRVYTPPPPLTRCGLDIPVVVVLSLNSRNWASRASR